MGQLDLVTNCQTIRRDHLDIQLATGFLSGSRANDLLHQLLEATPWQQPRVKVWGKRHLTPRLIALYGDHRIEYTYSESLHTALAWTPELDDIKRNVEQSSRQKFNAALLNYYRDGQDTIGWHADDEPELGHQPVIASLSLGAARDLHFRSKTGNHASLHLNLPSGSLLIMRGETQQYWQHHLPRRARCTEPRVNLTFRNIYPINQGPA